MMMAFELERMTLAATDVDAMLHFYNTVLDTGFELMMDKPLYMGLIGGVEAVLCPNTIAQVDAKQCRIQLRLRVDDIDEVVEKAKANGGSFMSETANENARMAAVRDPDGNSIELIQWFG
jgi:predicted enzyme related to lactoylglutathione lyase